MESNSFPSFQTERLILRKVTENHIASYQKYFNDYEVIQHLAGHVPWPFPENGVRQFLEKSVFPTHGTSQWIWGIFEKQNPNELIGAVHLWREGKPEHRGFWLGRPFWNKGYMTEAVNPVMDYAFNSLGFEKLIFANAVGNQKSRRIKEKTGAVIIRNEPAKFVNPKYTEHEIWELQKENWKNNSPNYFMISSNHNDLQIERIHNMLSNAYWCKDIPIQTLGLAIKNSLCFGIYLNHVQIGFARIVTDSATFAWLCDVIIVEKYRGLGLSKELVQNVLDHPDLKGLRRICLATKDAHELYQKFNFKVTETPQNWMEIKNNEIYLINPNAPVPN